MNIHARPAERQVISAEEVAGLLNFRCRRSFDDKRANLEAEGFPKKLPGLNGWSKPAIMRWLESNGAGGASNDDKPATGPTPLERRFA